MRTRAFQIRVLICFLLSLIPATDLENLVYSARMDFRGRWGRASDVVVVEVDSGDFSNPFQMRALQKTLQAQSPRLILVDANNPAEKPKDLVSDSDGVVRRALASSLSLRAWKALRDGPPPERLLKGPHLINYVGPPGTVPHCQPRQLGQAPACDDLKGKIVVVGEEAEPTALLRTPMGEMSRTETLAQDVHAVVNRQPIREASWFVRSLIILGLVLVSAFYIIYYPVILSAMALAGTGIVVVLVLFQLIFQLFGYYIPSLNIGASMLITYLIFTGYRLAYQENLQWRAVKQAQYLKELDQLKTNFLSLLSHDLKTPLAKIQAGVDRLRREAGAPREVVESLENSNQELKRYIESILSLSKIESQKVILNKKSNDINRVIEFALKRLRPLAAQKAIQIEADLEPLFSVECDEDLMRQVVSNLIDNAIKYSPEGARVLVRSREEDGFIRVEVEDFGPGIPKDQLPLVFRKFSRFFRPQGQGVKEQVRGTGLGLYLSKYFIELHGGSIALKTVEGQGTTFTFKLPIEAVADGAAPRALTMRGRFDNPLRYGAQPERPGH
jgi:signal transduction histidine kinase